MRSYLVEHFAVKDGDEGEIHFYVTALGAYLQQLFDDVEGEILLLFELFDDVEDEEVLLVVMGHASLHDGWWKQSLGIIEADGSACHSCFVGKVVYA